MKWHHHPFHETLPEAELFVVDIETGLKLIVRGVAAFPQVLSQDVGQVGQVLHPHRPVRLDGHLVQDEVVPVLHRAHHRLLHLLFDVVLNLWVGDYKLTQIQWQAVYEAGK